MREAHTHWPKPSIRDTLLEDARRELEDHLKRLLGSRGVAKIAPGQGVLFGGTSEDLSTAIEDLIAPEEGDEEAVELNVEDAAVPDAERASDKAPKGQRSRGRRKMDESNLRREVQRCELPHDQRRCPETGVELVETGVKVTTELSYKSAEVFLVEHHQVIYGPAPDVAKERTIAPLAAPLPPVAVEGVRASVSLLAWLVCPKYVLHLPL